jgi:UDP:flavonoid glycosyltransferase YjiC (YdhE family)
VLLVTSGGSGDVAPYTGLGVRLREAGYEVTVATHEPFAPMIQACGLGFRALPGDPREFLHGPSAQGGGWRGLEEHNVRTGEGIAAAAEAGADILLLAVTTSQLGTIVAEGLGLPSLGVHLQPTEPTREFASVLVPASLGPWGNRASARVTGAMVEAMNAKAAKHLRARFGLAPRTLRAQQRRQARQCWPICCGVSPHVVPPPRDWRAGVELVGYWWPEPPEDWTPPAELVDFLAAGPPPVCIGFGSLAGDADRLAEVIPQALRRAGVRGVVQAGWGGLDAGAGDDVLSIGEAPHEWLFPQMAAVVHAAGTGVTAAGLRAGVPAVPVPVGLDQPFWGRRLVEIGVSPDTVPFPSLSAERLADALQVILADPSYAERAAALAHRIRAEDGATRTVEIVRRILG